MNEGRERPCAHTREERGSRSHGSQMSPPATAATGQTPVLGPLKIIPTLEASGDTTIAPIGGMADGARHGAKRAEHTLGVRCPVSQLPCSLLRGPYPGGRMPRTHTSTQHTHGSGIETPRFTPCTLGAHDQWKQGGVFCLQVVGPWKAVD